MAIVDEWYDEALFVLKSYTLKYCSNRGLHTILKHSDIIHLNAGDILFSQDEVSLNVYVVLRGRLSAELLSSGASQAAMVSFSRGALLGEIGIITGAARSMHVIANRDAILIQIKPDVFKEVYTKYISSNAEQMNDLYLTQLRRNRRLLESTYKSVSSRFTTLIQTHASVPLPELINKIKLLHPSEEELFILPVETLNDINKKDKIIDYLIELEKEHQHILIVILAVHSRFIEEILDFSDHVIIIANGNEPPHKSEITKDLLSPRNRHAYNIKDVLLIHNTYHDKKYASEWVKLKPSLHIIHYFSNDIDSLNRIYRYFASCTVGLVLSGAGYRGIAYIGALKALKEYNIPIDAIGGTSMGAIIGACFIASYNEEEFNQLMTMLIKDIHRTFSWKELILSKTSVFSGKSSLPIAHRLNKHNIEELPLPFFCISCDLSEKREIRHFNGKLGDALRASSAVPGLLPPMVMDGHLLVDGAVVNNTPVNVMRTMVTQEGTVITIDLSNLETINHDYLSIETISPLQSITNFVLRRNKNPMPDLRKILLTSLLMHGESKLEINMDLSTVYIKPNLSQYSFLPNSKTTKEQLIQLGYQATVDAIKSHPTLMKYASKN